MSEMRDLETLLMIVGATGKTSVRTTQIAEALEIGAITLAEGKVLLMVSRLDPRGRKYQALWGDHDVADTSQALTEVKATKSWREEKAALIDSRTDLSADERTELHRFLQKEWGARVLAVMPKKKSHAKRTHAQMRADLGLD